MTTATQLTLDTETTAPGTMPVAHPVAPTVRFVGVIESEALGIVVTLARFRTVIGRRHADVLVDDPDVSRQHAMLERYDERYLLRDLGSTNGTWVNGQRVEVELLSPGDMIQVGGTKLLFRIELT